MIAVSLPPEDDGPVTPHLELVEAPAGASLGNGRAAAAAEEASGEDEDEDVDALTIGGSFFDSSRVLDARIDDHAAWDAIERADALAAARVWNIFAKASNARGIDCRSRGSRAASLTRRLAAAGEEDDDAGEGDAGDDDEGPGEATVAKRIRGRRGGKITMVQAQHHTNGTTALDARLKVTLAAYNAQRTKLGRVPTNPELEAALGGAEWATPSAVSRARKTLIEKGLAEAAPRGGNRRGAGEDQPAKASRAKAPKAGRGRKRRVDADELVATATPAPARRSGHRRAPRDHGAPGGALEGRRRARGDRQGARAAEGDAVSGHPPAVQMLSRLPIFDRTVLEALTELRDAIRSLDELESEDVSQKSLAFRELHKRQVQRAKARHLAARAALEALLLGEEG